VRPPALTDTGSHIRMQDTNGAEPAQDAPRRALAVRRWWPALAVVGLLGVASVAAAFSAPETTRLAPPEGLTPKDLPTNANADPSRDAASGSDGEVTRLLLPDWVQQVMLFACLAVALAAIGVLLWFVIRDRISVRRGALVVERGASPSQQRTQDVIAALDAGLDELSDLDADPRRAVIACWVRLEHAAAAAGTPRRIGDTPTELVVRLLGAHQVDRGVLDRFAGIYREARYATHDVDPGMRTQAIAALRQLRAELAAPAELAR
jgi:Domain of unknown function (DUF4129)